MGLLNCKCDAEQDKTVAVEALGKNKIQNTAPIEETEVRFTDLIQSHREELAISAKAIWDALPKFIYAEEFEEITDWESFKLPEGTYFGESVNSQPHGRGFQILKDGSIIEAHWEDGLLCGRGRMIYSNGDYYIGEFFAGKIDGKGILMSQNGAKYEGEWRNNVQDGEGKELWPNGAEFIGQFKSGMKNGKGTFWWHDGSTYEGEFSNNNIHGYGRYEWSDERKYEGQWVDNKMHGKGTFVWPNGRIYEGEFLNDLKHGYGKLVWQDGKTYIGGWFKGKRHGIGSMSVNATTAKKGEWKDGVRVRWLDS